MGRVAFGAEHDDRIDGLEPRGGLAQRSRGQQPAIAEAARAVDDGDLDAPRQAVMLQSVVGQDHVAPRMPGEERPAGSDPVAGDDDGIAGACEQQRLVADPARIVLRTDRERRARLVVPAVAAAHDPRPEPALRQRQRERGHERRLAGAADRDVADDDHRSAHLDRVPHADPVERAPGRHADAEQERERQQDERDGRGPRRIPRGDEAFGKRHGARAPARSARHFGSADWVAKVTWT